MNQKLGVLLVLLVCTVLTLTGATPGQVLIDDFRDGNDVGWTHLDGTLGTPFGPGIFDASSSVYHFESTGPVPDGELGALASFWDGSAGLDYQDGYVRVKMSTAVNTVAYVILRGDVSLGNFYLFGIDPSNAPPAFFFNRIEGGEVTRLDGFDLVEQIDVGEDWIIEAGAVDDQLSFKAWKPGETVPAAPQWTGVDVVLASGLFGVGANRYSPQPEPASVVSATFDDVYFTAVPEPNVSLFALITLSLSWYRRIGL